MVRSDLLVHVDGRTITVPSSASADIGSDPSCAVQVAGAGVAPHHAVLWCTEEGWLLADRGTGAGTWVDGGAIDRRSVGGSTTVRLGDSDTGPLIELVPAPALVPAPSTVAPLSTSEVQPFQQAIRPSRPDLVRPTGIYATTFAPSPRMRIGRDPANAIVVEDLMVSRFHAELRMRSDGSADLMDQGSLNGTFVNGARITETVIREGDLVTIGNAHFRLVGGGFEEYLDTGSVTFEATGIVVTDATGRRLVDDVGFSLGERSLLGIVGPSGSGKSTLLGALSGLRPATQGTVLYGGRDLYRDYDELRFRIGLVPQDDVLHRQLELRRALEYAGRLRFPSDVDAAQRNARIDEVLGELGIGHRADAPIHRLSGGERKRTSVALELLTRPSLLLLDEPASGLDPGLARTLMRLLRDLADDGRTVVVVTHELASLALCDQVLVLAPGGVPAYVGPPAGALARFGCDDMAEVFSELAAHPHRDWRPGPARPSTSTPVPASGSAEGGAAEGAGAAGPAVPRQRRRWWLQLRTLVARSFEVIWADRRNAALLLLQAPVLGVLILAALPAGELSPPPASELRLVSAAGIVLFVLLVGATWLGANNAVREIAAELAVLRRERAVGLSLSAYVVSKAVVLGSLTVVQSVVLVGIATARQRGPTDAVVLGWGPGELMVMVAMTGVAAMALALFVSAVAGSAERATSILPVVLILQLVLAAGVVLPEIVDKPVLRQLSLASATQWGIAGSASTADLNGLQVFDQRLRSLRTIDATDPGPAVAALTSGGEVEGRWAHTPSAWFTALGMLLLLTVVPLIGTALALRRFDPGR